MPNGGSDCCGTCWFNARNKGVAGYAHAKDPDPSHCDIRNLEIPDPFWTYCANHPHRRPDRDPIPIGPVFVDPKDAGRSVWTKSPDSEEIRNHLLGLLAAMIEAPAQEYPIGGYFDEIVVWQLGEFRELRAMSDLHRVAAFSLDATTERPVRTRATLVGVAEAAMVKIAAAHSANYDPAARFDSRRTMPHHLQFEQWVPFPLEHVFGFFSNPENLPRMMPESSATKLIEVNRRTAPSPSPGVASDKAAGVGSTIVTSFRVFPGLPIEARWIARITEFEWNRYFADVQAKGPFKSWHHRHEFVAETRNGVSGTLVRDVIDYEVGFGFAGVVTNAVFVRRQMQATFAQRQQVLPQLLA